MSKLTRRQALLATLTMPLALYVPTHQKLPDNRSTWGSHGFPAKLRLHLDEWKEFVVMYQGQTVTFSTEQIFKILIDK